MRLNWTGLFEEFKEAERHREVVSQRRSEEAAALEEFEAWCQENIERLMQDLKARAAERSQEFLQATDRELQVQYPSGPPILVPDNGPEIRFLRLQLGSAQVHIYTSHALGGVTHVHLLPSRTSSLKENDRLVSEPGAFVVRLPDDGYELRYLKGDPESPEGGPMQLDALLYRAFRLLLNWFGDC